LVDDDQQVLDLLERRLGRAGLSAIAALTAGEALAALSSVSPDAVLLDLHLGNGVRDGLSCLGGIRAAGFLGPVFVVSGDASNESAHASIRAGADGFFVKRDCESLVEELIASLRGASSVAEHPLPEVARAYLASRGLTAWEIALLAEYAEKHGREKTIAERLGRSETAVRKMFQEIRDKLGLENQYALAQFLGVLSCMGGRRGYGGEGSR
jgi:DNA-binding NarL/FixJ family response regulator